MRDRKPTPPAPYAPWTLLAVVAAVLFVAYVRLRVADVPLERDEGEYAYAGQLILEGVPPYALAYNMKFPGTYYAYALILSVFGHTPWGIHTGLMLVNAASILLIYAIGRRVLGEFAAASAAVSFAILSVDRAVLGVFAHATHFVVLFALAGLFVLLHAIENDRRAWFLWSGVLLGLSVLMKQHAVFFLPLAAWLVVRCGSARKVGLLAIGALLPLALIVTVLFAQGALERFWFWTFHYARAYVSEVPLAKAIPNLVTSLKVVTSENPALWVVGGLGLAALWIRPWDARARGFVTGLLGAAFLAICPGFFFREHYFILLLPAVALLAGVAVASLRDVLLPFASSVVATALAVAVLVAAVSAYVIHERTYLFSMDAREISFTVYGNSPFVEAVEIAKYIREHTDVNDRIAVLGSEPEIYFYAQRKGATGYIYTYPMMEPQSYAKTMQQEMIREIEAAHPRYLVFSWIKFSWLPKPESDQSIITWGQSYVRKCYDPVGVADLIPGTETRFVWDEANVRNYVAKSPDLVYVFRRKSDAPCTASE